MNRRGFFGRMLGALAGAAVAKPTAPPPVAPPVDGFYDVPPELAAMLRDEWNWLVLNDGLTFTKVDPPDAPHQG